MCASRSLGRAACGRLATGPTALALIEGAAGSGMTTSLRLVTTQYRGLGKTVLATATAWRTAQMLHEELGVEARAVDSLLARARTDRAVLDCNTVLLVDEAGQIGSRAMHSLLTLARERVAKVVLVGDPAQLQAIAAGPALRLRAEVSVPARVATIVRQRASYAREAVTAMSEARVPDAMRIFARHDLVEEQISTGTTATWRSAVREARPGSSSIPGCSMLQSAPIAIRTQPADRSRRQHGWPFSAHACRASTGRWPRLISVRPPTPCRQPNALCSAAKASISDRDPGWRRPRCTIGCSTVQGRNGAMVTGSRQSLADPSRG
ncbi:hypothetical protein C0214_18395 [Methylobacterium sp. DM1]|nr:hypothetical protein C0214_18395 [Methylobacterium sp. DM1]